MKKESNNNKSWESVNELAMIYEETLREKFDFKKADRNKKVFGDDEDDEEEEDCGEEEEQEQEQDACYEKVKSRYNKAWPSAYASGALVKCRKVGAKNWGNSKK